MDFPALPAGFDATHTRAAWFAVRRDYAEAFEQWGLHAETGEPFEPTELKGRAVLEAIRGSAGQVLARRFRHGGLFGSITGRRYANPARPFLELVLSERLRAAGLPTPTVVGARARARWPFGWELELFTQRVPGARDLGSMIEAHRQGQLGLSAWHRLLESTGTLIGRAHAQGFLHADLHPKNLLAGEAGELYLIDLDGSRFEPDLSDADRVANLERFWRWIVREDNRSPFLDARDPLRFLRAWRQAGGGLGVREVLEQVDLRHQRHALLHSAGRTLQRRS